jgi:hypothetical protein
MVLVYSSRRLVVHEGLVLSEVETVKGGSRGLLAYLSMDPLRGRDKSIMV